MTTYLGKSCSFGLPRVAFVNCGQFMYIVISLLVLRAGCGICLYQFLIIAYLFTLLYLTVFRHIRVSRLTETDRNRPKQTGMDRNGPTKNRNGLLYVTKRTGTDFSGYQNGPKQTSAHAETNFSETSVGTETDRNRLQLIPK